MLKCPHVFEFEHQSEFGEPLDAQIPAPTVAPRRTMAPTAVALALQPFRELQDKLAEPEMPSPTVLGDYSKLEAKTAGRRLDTFQQLATYLAGGDVAEVGKMVRALLARPRMSAARSGAMREPAALLCSQPLSATRPAALLCPQPTTFQGRSLRATRARRFESSGN